MNSEQLTRILIAEDDIIVAREIESRLKSLGYPVPVIASSGQEAIQKVAATQPHLVLIDIRLKGEMDGVETAAQIQLCFDIPVVYLTPEANEETLQRARITEPFGYVLKPFPSRELHTTIEMALYQHKLENKLKTSEQQLAATLKSINDAMIATDAKGAITFMNPMAEALTGWQQAQALGQELTDVFNLINEETHQPDESVTKVLQEGVDVDLAHQSLLVAKDKTESLIAGNVAPIKDGAGNTTGLVVVFRDITERKQTQETLARRVREMEALYETSLEINVQLDVSTLLRAIVRRAARLLGTHMGGLFLRQFDSQVLVWVAGYNQSGDDPGDVRYLGEKLASHIAQTSEPMMVADYRHWEGRASHQVNGSIGRMLGVPLKQRDQVIGVLNVFDEQVGTFDEEEVWLLSMFAAQATIAIENAQLYEQARQEIVERKRAEAETRRRNRELILFNQIITASVAELKPEVMLEIACRELALAFEIPRVVATMFDKKKTTARVVAKSLFSDPSQVSNKIISIENNPAFQFLLTHKSPLVVNDPQTQNSLRLEPIHDLQGQHKITSLLLLPLIIGEEVVGSLNLESVERRDFSSEEINLAWSVADQVSGALARARLAQTHQLLTTAIEQAAESVVITDTEGFILYVNPVFERLSGYSWAEVIGQKPSILKSGKQDLAFYQELWATITAGKVWRGRFVNKRKDGTFYTEEATITPVRGEDDALVNYVAVKRDVTRELQLEEQYHQAQKMEAIGRLAGGVAHDFNNLLTAIMGYAGLTLRALSPNALVYSDIQEIQKNAERATNLTRQLLTFARKQVITPSVLNLNDLILDVDKILRRLIGEDVELVTLPEPDLGQVKADPGQIEQVLLNLAVNARDAMPNGGKLIIETANVTFDEDYVREHAGVMSGQYVMLAVSDTGMGMTEEIKTHLFEPFFTTKEVGKGTGLGLATCFGIVKQSGGHIWVYSEVDQGTTFKVYLPRIAEIASPSFNQDQYEYLPYGTETVLVVEDEPSVRTFVVRTLRKQGYHVLEAANGDEAFRVAQIHTGTEIHLLLTDVVMPRLSGRDLADQIRTIYPNIRVLFTSGYTDNLMVHRGVLEPHMAFLPKPFSPNMLARKVRDVLDK